jgi:predicted nucleic acid-binding protein
LQLAVDASVVVGEALRARGRLLLQHPSLDLLIATETADEALHELPRRVRAAAARRPLTPAETTALLSEAAHAVATSLTVAAPRTYAARMEEAVARLPRDGADAPTLALALTLDCGIWTADRDFFGCGAPVWSTETLLWFVRSHG